MRDAPTIRLTGAREFRRALRQVSADAAGDMKVAHAEAAEIVEREARRRAPVRSGALADTVRSSGTLTKGIVRSGFARVPYAGPIHFGWPKRNIMPQPFMYDAIDDRREEVLDVYGRRVYDIARRHGLSPSRF